MVEIFSAKGIVSEKILMGVETKHISGVSEIGNLANFLCNEVRGFFLSVPMLDFTSNPS